MTEILTQAQNPSTGVYETIDREPGTAADLANAELSAEDLGCEPGTLYRLVLVDDEDRELDVREVVATGDARPRRMERHELEAWLGDDLGGLKHDEVTELLGLANDIEARYPDEDAAEERQSALTAAYRLMVESPEDVVDEFAQKLFAARLAEAEVLAAIRQAAIILTPKGWTENGFANAAGVDRMAVRKWLGKR